MLRTILESEFKRADGSWHEFLIGLTVLRRNGSTKGTNAAIVSALEFVKSGRAFS
jgi:hypothetical protein